MSPVGPPAYPTRDCEGNLVPISPPGPPPSPTQDPVWNAALGVPDQGPQVPLDQNAQGDLSYIPMPQEDENNNDGDIATWIASLEIGQFRQSPEREEGRQQWFAQQDQQVHENLAQAIKEGRQDITLDAILKSQQMKTPADLSEDEMRSEQCEICQENLWPKDAGCLRTGHDCPHCLR